MTPAELTAWAVVGLLTLGILATLAASWLHRRPRSTRAQIIASEMRACLERDKAESDARQWRAIAQSALERERVLERDLAAERDRRAQCQHFRKQAEEELEVRSAEARGMGVRLFYCTEPGGWRVLEGRAPGSDFVAVSQLMDCPQYWAFAAPGNVVNLRIEYVPPTRALSELMEARRRG